MASSTEVPLPDLEPVLSALQNYVAHIRSLEPSLPDAVGNDKPIGTTGSRRLLRVRQAEFRGPADLFAC